MIVLVLAFLLGVVSGLRSFVGICVVSWAAHLHKLRLGGTSAAFLGGELAPYLLSLAVVTELIADKVPGVPSRRAVGPFLVRIVTGAGCGAAVCLASGSGLTPGAIAGALGAVGGTVGGFEIRMALAKVVGKDWPVAVVEDLYAIISAILIVSRFG